MARQRPVPRTLSDILKRIQKPSRDPEGLISPEELTQIKPPITEPGELFKNMSPRPLNPQEEQAEAARERLSREGIANPSTLFGGRSWATPGQTLAQPHELDFEPTQPQEPVVLTSLEEVMKQNESPHVAFVDEPDVAEPDVEESDVEENTSP